MQRLENGCYTTIFTAPDFETPTNVTITATVSKTDCTTVVATAQITVLPEQILGNLQIYVRDGNSFEPVGNVTVVLTSQTSDDTNLNAVTDNTGYVVFPNCVEGDYTISLDKQDYVPMETDLSFKSTDGPIDLYITRIGEEQSTSDGTIVGIILIVVIVSCVVALVAVLMWRRRQMPGLNIPPPK